MRHLTFFVAISFLFVVVAAVLFSQAPSLQAPKTTPVSVALVDADAIAQGEDCSSAITFVPRSLLGELDLSGTARALVALSLSGPTPAEAQLGLTSQFSSEVAVVSAEVAHGVATVVLTENANDIAGSCAVGAARSQIESTLKTLPGVEVVVIRIEGVSEGEELQP